MVSSTQYRDNFPLRKIAPQLGLESRLGLILGLGRNQTIAPEEDYRRLGLGLS